MRALLPKLRLLLGSLTCMFLVGCTVDDATPPPPEGINTLNIFFDNNEIFSVSPETGIATKRAEFDAGTQALKLNTNDEKQGFEFVVYVNNGSIFLLDYVTAENKLITTFTGEICDIFTELSPSKFAFTDANESNRSFINKPSIVIAFPNGANCDPESNFLDRVEFATFIDDIEFNEETLRTSLNRALFNGDLIVDFSSGTFEDDELINDLTGFLGYDINQLHFNFYKEGENAGFWRTLLPFASTPPSIWQASTNQVLVQIDANLYTVSIGTLFSINTPENASSSIQAQIDALFEDPAFTLPSSDKATINFSPNTDTFLVKQNNKFYFYDGASFNELAINIEPDVINVTFDLTTDNRAIVLKEFANSFILVQVNTTSNVSSTVISSSEKLDFKLKNDEIYINTFNQQGSTGWQAILVDSNQTKITFDNSRFLFFKDTREQLDTILLLSPDQVEQPDFSIKEQLSIYDFDSGQPDGRRRVRLNGAEVGFSFGRLQIDVNSILDSDIVNDIYGFIKFDGSRTDAPNVSRNVTEAYFFNPSQTESSKEEQTLRLINLPE